MTNPDTAPHGAALTVVLCALAALFEGIDLQVAGVAAAGIVPQFKPDPQHLGVFFSSSTLGLVCGALIGGRMSDWIGRKRVLVASVAAFGGFSLMAASASTMSDLVWARLLTGLGLGGAFPILVALTAESSTEARRSSNVTIVYSAMPFGGAIISLLSMLVAPVHWRYLFVVGGLCPVIVAPVMAAYLRESPAFKQAREAGGAAVSAEGFLAVLTGGLARNTLLLWSGFLLSLLTLYLLLNWLPTLLLGYGLNKPQASVAQIAFNLGGAIAALGMGRLLDGSHRRGSMAAVFSALPALLACLALAPRIPWMIVSIVLLLGIVVLASQAGMYAMAPACYPTRIRGVGVGTAVAVGRIGSIVGPAIAGVLVAHGLTTSQLLFNLVPVSVVGGICAVTLAWTLLDRHRSS
jgi:MFS transporter, AAHS family, 3-hydroxyphenylpropionic acid transporter